MIDVGVGGLAAAFAAGAITFLSPCVLPLVPGYLALVSGVVSDQDIIQQRARVLRATATFVLGFGAMFVALGAGAALFGDILLTNRRTLEIGAGLMLALGGLVLIGLRLPMIVQRERRYHLPRHFGAWTPLAAGAAFAVGWTPCIGPTLAAILALSARGGEPAQGALLLAVFSLGLGLPFMLFGAAWTRMIGMLDALRPRLGAIHVVSGAVLVVFGILLASGHLAALTGRLGAIGIEV